MPTGHCHCGALRYEVTGNPLYKALCHCEDCRRHFCPDCGTGLFYYNEVVLPGLVDIQIATLDDPETMAPTANIQVADRLAWMTKAHDLPAFDRYPAPE